MNIEVPDARSIAERLPRDTVFRRVEVLASTGSTNADLAARARDGETEGTALIAMEQTAGRGRLDRQWVSPPGMSISMSLLLAPRPDLTQWGWLSILAGMAVSSALTSVAPDPSAVTLKWPNDVLIGGRKVAGILAEVAATAPIPSVVIGVGLNVTLTESELPVPTATSLLLAGAATTDRDAVAAALLRSLSVQFTAWQQDGWRVDGLAADYRARCGTLGQRVRVQLPGDVELVGVATDVDLQGRIVVCPDGGGAAVAVSAGDVTHVRSRT